MEPPQLAVQYFPLFKLFLISVLDVLHLLDRLRQDLRLLLEDAGLVIDVEIVIDDGVVPILIGEVIGPHLVVQILVVVLKTREFYINKAGTSFNVAYAPLQFLVHYIEGILTLE